MHAQLKMLVQITSGGVLCFVWVGFVVGWVVLLLFCYCCCLGFVCLCFFDKLQEAGTTLPTESKDSWQPRTRDTLSHPCLELHRTYLAAHIPKEEQTHQGLMPKQDFDEEDLHVASSLTHPQHNPGLCFINTLTIFEKSKTGSHQQGRQSPGRAHTRMNVGLSRMFLGNHLPRHTCQNTNCLYTILVLLLPTCVKSMGLTQGLYCKAPASLAVGAVRPDPIRNKVFIKSTSSLGRARQLKELQCMTTKQVSDFLLSTDYSSIQSLHHIFKFLQRRESNRKLL